MTLAEVIDTLQTWIRNADDEYDREEMGRVAGLKEALHEIKKIDMCDDAISRDELLKAMDTWDKFGYTETGCFVREPKNDCVKYIHYDDVTKCIKGMPTVNPQPKTGHWEWVQYDYNPKLGNWHCSECRCVVVECVDKNEKGGIPLYKYCPQCGAKMVEPQAESKEKTCEGCINAKECVMYDPSMKRCKEYKADPKEIYNKGFADGQKALAEHLKLCKEELLGEIRAEIDEQYDRIHPNNIYTAEGLEIALDIIDKYKAESEDKE